MMGTQTQMIANCCESLEQHRGGVRGITQPHDRRSSLWDCAGTIHPYSYVTVRIGFALGTPKPPLSPAAAI